MTRYNLNKIFFFFFFFFFGGGGFEIWRCASTWSHAVTKKDVNQIQRNMIPWWSCPKLLSGLVAGLTLGLLSLDITTLQVLSTAGTPSEQVYATRILPLVKNSHLLLVTLILANAAAVESMPIFLDHVTNPIIAVAVSVTAVLIFGE